MKKYLALALMSLSLVSTICAFDDVTPYNAVRTLGCQKIDYHGHTYLHFMNGWGSGDAVVHDPDCDLCENRVDLEDLLIEMKRISFPQVDDHLIETFFQEVRKSMIVVHSDDDKADKKKKKKKH